MTWRWKADWEEWDRGTGLDCRSAGSSIRPWTAPSQKDWVEKHRLISSPYGHHLTECLRFWNNSNHLSVHCSRQRMHEKNVQFSKAHTHSPSRPIKLTIKCHYIKLLLGKRLWKKLWRIVHIKKHRSTINWRKYIAHFMHLEYALPAKIHHKIKIDIFLNGMQYLSHLTMVILFTILINLKFKSSVKKGNPIMTQTLLNGSTWTSCNTLYSNQYFPG